MTALEQHRITWPDKSDEWLFERLDGELKSKVNTIHNLLEENQKLNELMRWRDPKVEPPTNQDIVLVKTDNDCYATAYFHGKVSGFICYGEDAYIEFGDIIGWRPIE